MSHHLGIIFVGGTLSIAEIVSLFYRNRIRKNPVGLTNIPPGIPLLQFMTTTTSTNAINIPSFVGEPT